MIDDWTRVTDDPKRLPPVGMLILRYFPGRDGHLVVTRRAADEDVNDAWLTPPGDERSVWWAQIELPC